MPQAVRATARVLAGLLLLAAQAAATHPSRHTPRTMIADTLTPLHTAARNGQLERVQELVQLGLRQCDEARLPYLERQACYKGGTVESLDIHKMVGAITSKSNLPIGSKLSIWRGWMGNVALVGEIEALTIGPNKA